MEDSTLNRWLPLFALVGVALTLLALWSLLGASAGAAVAINAGAVAESNHNFEQLPNLVASLREPAKLKPAAHTLRSMVVRWRSLDQQTANRNRLALMKLLATEQIGSTLASRTTAADLCESLLASTVEIPREKRTIWLKHSKHVLQSASSSSNGPEVTGGQQGEQLPGEFFAPLDLPRLAE